MSYNGSNKAGTYSGIAEVENSLTEAQQELMQAKRKSEKEKLKDLINDLKLDLGWALICFGEYERGLAAYQSVFGENYQACFGIGGHLGSESVATMRRNMHQERKYNGIGRR
jgi:hypothetical protein